MGQRPHGLPGSGVPRCIHTQTPAPPTPHGRQAGGRRVAGLSPPRSGVVHREGKGLTCQALGPFSQHLLPSGPFCQLG